MGMRYREINEAPLSDFNVMGSADEPGSFRADDLRAMSNPKWQEKLHNTFSRTPYEINIYALNAPNSRHRYSYENRGQKFIDGFPVGLEHRREYIGEYSPANFERKFGFLPKNYENAITALFTFNDGSERLPFTQWIIAHRLLHALGERSGERSNTSHVSFVFDYINEALRDVGTLLNHIDPERDDLHQVLQAEDTLSVIGRTKAMRTKNLSGLGESMPEWGAEYLVNGAIRLNRLTIKEPFAAFLPGRGRISVDQDFANELVSHLEANLNGAYENLFNGSVGKIFVL